MRKAGGFSPGASEPADPRMLTSIGFLMRERQLNKETRILKAF